MTDAIFADDESIIIDAMHRNHDGKWKKWAQVSRNAVYCQWMNLINDPPLKHEARPQCTVSCMSFAEP